MLITQILFKVTVFLLMGIYHARHGHEITWDRFRWKSFQKSSMKNQEQLWAIFLSKFRGTHRQERYIVNFVSVDPPR